MDYKEFSRTKQFVADDGGTDSIIAGSAPGVTDHVRVAFDKSSELGGIKPCNLTSTRPVRNRAVPARIHEVVSSRRSDRFLAKFCTSVRGTLANGIGGDWPTFRY